MSKRSMAGVILLICTLGGVFGQREWIRTLRAQQRDLLALVRQQSRVRESLNRPGLESHISISASIDHLRLKNRDLLKLRNEVAFVRAQKRRFDELLSETAHLARLQGESAPIDGPEGYISGAEYAFAGFHNPEQAAQNICWAVRQKDIAAMLRCLPPETAADWMDDPQYVERRFSEHFSRFTDGYRIVATKALAPHELLLRLRAPSGLETALPLRLAAGEWKLKDMNGF